VKYEYHCAACLTSLEVDFLLGKAEPSVVCKCGGSAKRVFSAVSVSVRGGNVSTERTFGQEMLRRNRKAAERMKANRPKVRRVATDYGNGDVREVV
jgi:predicted nucleic acid-binding Zn ribbon protein